MIVDPAICDREETDMGGVTLFLSNVGGLTQFGAYVDTLVPGAFSSKRHWHSAEDEFLFMLSGTATVIDDDGAHDLNPGDAACWRHGDTNAHHVTNRGDTPCSYLIIGSRVECDICSYPDSGWRVVNTATTWAVFNETGGVERSGDLPPQLLNLAPVWGKPFDPALPTRRILRKGSVAPIFAQDPSHDFDDLGMFHAVPLSDEGGLSQFGAFTEMLMPGAQSSQRHWHEAEDEFLYVLDGTVTLIENDGSHRLSPGDCACWPAGVANGHCLRNETEQPITYFIAGSRLAEDAVHYPDIDLHYTRKNGQRMVSHKDGTPYPGWPKETNR